MELVRNLKVECVERLEPPKPHSLDAATPVGQAIDRMRQEKIGCLLVCDAGKLVGVFTERDLMCRVLGTGKALTVPLKEVMTPHAVTVRQDDSIGTAIRRMQQGGYRHLPVVDHTDRPVGVLSVKRIVRYLVEHYPAAVYNLPPDPHAVPENPEGA